MNDIPGIPGEKVFISLSPGASSSFDQHKISYKSISDYRDTIEQYPPGLELYTKIETVVSILDKELKPLCDIPSLTPARYSFYHLYFLFNVIWNTIHILKGIVETERPSFIRLYAKPEIRSRARTCAFPHDESINAEVLKMPGWNIPVEILQESREFTACKPSTLSRLLASIKRQDLFFNLGMVGKRNGIASLASVVYYHITCRDRNPVLIYGSGYNWDDSLAELYQSGLFPVYRFSNKIVDDTQSTSDRSVETIRRILRIHPGMREFDYIHDINVSGFLAEWIPHIVGASVRESITAYNLASETIRQHNIRCLLHSVRDRAIGHAVVQAAHDAGIPVVSWQHGGAGYCFHPLMPFIEFINSDYHLVFGEGVARSFSDTSKQLGLEKVPGFIPVGSGSLDTFMRGIRKNPAPATNRSIVYVTTHYSQNVIVLPQQRYPDHDEYLWAIQKQMIDLAKKNPGREFIIKIHPLHKDQEPLISYIREHEIQNVKIVASEQSLQELIACADVVIFDLVTTGILQVLTSNLPVFVYTGLYTIDPDPEKQLGKRAYVYDSVGKFINGIDEYVNTGQVTGSSADCSDTCFMMNYGTDIQSHDSARKAMIKLLDIVSSHTTPR